MTFTERWQPGLDYLARSVRKFGAVGKDLPAGADSPFHPAAVAGWHSAMDSIGALLASHREYEELKSFYRGYIRDRLSEGAPAA